MGLKGSQAKKGSGGVHAPAGSHVARCFWVIDLGTHTQPGKFGIKTNRKLRIAWELPEETHVFDKKRGPEPFAVSRTYNFVFGEKANLQKDLQNWFGKKLTPEAIDVLDIEKLVGEVCLLNVQENEADNGNTYANVAGISPLPKGMTVKPAVAKPVYYDVTMGKNDVFDSLPEWLQKIIEKCEEFGPAPEVDKEFLGTSADASEDGNFLAGDEVANTAANTVANEHVEDDDEIPF